MILLKIIIVISNQGRNQRMGEGTGDRTPSKKCCATTVGLVFLYLAVCYGRCSCQPYIRRLKAINVANYIFL